MSSLGEANANRNRDKYQCSFPAMISEWRRVWSTMSSTGNQFPFGFVQLSTWNANDMSPGFPMIRWHQTGDFGFVPNDEMKVLLDLNYVKLIKLALLDRMYSWQLHWTPTTASPEFTQETSSFQPNDWPHLGSMWLTDLQTTQRTDPFPTMLSFS